MFANSANSRKTLIRRSKPLTWAEILHYKQCIRGIDSVRCTQLTYRNYLRVEVSDVQIPRRVGQAWRPNCWIIRCAPMEARWEKICIVSEKMLCKPLNDLTPGKVCR